MVLKPTRAPASSLRKPCGARDPSHAARRPARRSPRGGIVRKARRPGGARPAHPRLTKVDAADQLAHDHDVHALHHLALEAGRVNELRQHRRRAQVGEALQARAQLQQAALRPQLRRQRVPLVPARPCVPARCGAACDRAVAAPAKSCLTATSAISGPMPSPGSSVTLCAAQATAGRAARGAARASPRRGRSGARCAAQPVARPSSRWAETMPARPPLPGAASALLLQCTSKYASKRCRDDCLAALPCGVWKAWAARLAVQLQH